MPKDQTSNKPEQGNLVGKRGSGKPHPMDTHAGYRLQRRRVEVGLTQGKLGAMVGLTFQQIQKYEHGANRISVSKLWMLSQALDVSVNYFFEDMPDELKNSPDGQTVDVEKQLSEQDKIHRRHHLQLSRLFSRLEKPSHRKCVLHIAETLVETEHATKA